MGRAWKINEKDLDEFGLDKPGAEKQHLDLNELNKRTGIALYEVSVQDRCIQLCWLYFVSHTSFQFLFISSELLVRIRMHS